MTTSKITSPLYEGKNLSIGSKEIELERTVSRESFLSGACFGNGVSSSAFSESSTSSNKKLIKKFIPPSSTAGVKPDRLAQNLHPKPHHATDSNLREDVCMNDHSESKPATALSEITNQCPHWAANW